MKKQFLPQWLVFQLVCQRTAQWVVSESVSSDLNSVCRCWGYFGSASAATAQLLSMQRSGWGQRGIGQPCINWVRNLYYPVLCNVFSMWCQKMQLCKTSQAKKKRSNWQLWKLLFFHNYNVSWCHTVYFLRFPSFDNWFKLAKSNPDRRWLSTC